VGAVIGAGAVLAVTSPAEPEFDSSAASVFEARAKAAERRATELEDQLAAARATTAPPIRVPTESPTTAATTTQQDDGQMRDKSFVVESVRIGDDGLGDFGGTARIRNESGSEKTALVTFTIFADGEPVGSLLGSVNAVSPGQSVTVRLISTDRYVPGATEYDFQVDVED
jgi:hypothetical protein